jgi:hypothetical protein
MGPDPSYEASISNYRIAHATPNELRKKPHAYVNFPQKGALGTGYCETRIAQVTGRFHSSGDQ